MWTLIKKESLENILTLRFVVGFLACNLLFGISTYVLVQDFNIEIEALNARIAESREATEDWTVLSQVRPEIFRMPSSIKVFGAGGAAPWGRMFEIGHTSIPVFARDTEIWNDLLGFYSGFDFSMVIQIFVSLLGLLFAFDAISGEKERGSLRLLLTSGVKRATVLGAKFIGSVIALATIIISGYVVALLVFLTSNPAQLGADDWFRLLIILLLTVVYGALFIAIGFMISSLTHRSATSLVAGMVVWVLWILILPGVVGLLSSKQGFEEDLRELNANLEQLSGDATAEQLKIFRKEIGEFGGDYMYVGNRTPLRQGKLRCRVIGKNAIRKLSEIIPSMMSIILEYANQRYALENEYMSRRLEKIELKRNLERLSPSSVFAHAVATFAKTDFNSQIHFISEARRYRDEFLNYIEGRGGYNSPLWFTDEPEHTDYQDYVEQMETLTVDEKWAHFNNLRSSDEGREFLRNLYSGLNSDPRRQLDLSDMPDFRMRSPSIGESLAAAQFDLFLLVVYIAVALGITLIRFISYDVR